MQFREKQVFWLSVTIVVLAGALRWWAIEIKPVHFDEGINGHFADLMVNTGYYDYDPTNFHGPLHFYAVFLSQQLFGRSLWALRLPAVLAGIAAVWIVLRFAPYLGQRATLLAALALACSPAFVFFSRYSIHESWLVLFNLLFVLGLFGIWRRGRAADLALVVAGIAGMILSKETYIIQIGCAVLALPCLLLWERLVPSGENIRPVAQQWSYRQLSLYTGLGIFAVVFFYSGTFLNWSGVAGLWQTYTAWFETGLEKDSGHAKTAYDWWGPLNYYWLALMARYEWPGLLGLAACALCMPRCSPLLRFLAIYGGGLLLAYSIIPYKTPWCIIALLWPLLLVGGGVISNWKGCWQRGGVIIWLSAVLVSVHFSLRLNFRNFADHSEPYVYVQTFPEITVLTGPVLELAKSDPLHYGMHGQLMLESYFPLPWVFGDFYRIGYHGINWPARLDGDFVVVEKDREQEASALLGEDYVAFDFRLREGQGPSVVFFRKTLFSEVLP